MKLYVDFLNFDEKTEKMLRLSIPSATSRYGWHWIEWAGRSKEQGRPDISLIYAHDLTWPEAAQMSNLATGKWVVLVGANAPKIGLPIVEILFKWTELSQFTGLTAPHHEADQQDTHPPRFSFTIPMSLTCSQPTDRSSLLKPEICSI